MEIEVDTKRIIIIMMIVVIGKTTKTKDKMDQMRKESINLKTKNIVTKMVVIITTKRKSNIKMKMAAKLTIPVTLTFKSMNTKRKNKHCKKNQRILKYKVNQKDFSPKLNNKLYR